MFLICFTGVEANHRYFGSLKVSVNQLAKDGVFGGPKPHLCYGLDLGEYSELDDELGIWEPLRNE